MAEDAVEQDHGSQPQDIPQPADPGDANFPDFAVETKQLFSNMLGTPLKAKHFAKPPIRFLYDLLRQVSFQIDGRGSKFFLSYVFDDPSLASAPKDDTSKVKFLQVVIDGVQHKCREASTPCPKIDTGLVARGHEPEKTCNFLIKIYDLAVNPEKFTRPAPAGQEQAQISAETAELACEAAIQSQSLVAEVEPPKLPDASVVESVEESEAAIKYQEMLKKLEGQVGSDRGSQLPSMENTDMSSESKSKESSKKCEGDMETVLAPVKDRLEKELERIEDMMNEVF